MELKLDINYLVRKYVKQLQKQPRKKYMYAALLTAIISALIIKFLTNNIIVILIFGASIVIFLYNFTYPLSQKLDDLSHRLFDKKDV